MKKELHQEVTRGLFGLAVHCSAEDSAPRRSPAATEGRGCERSAILLALADGDGRGRGGVDRVDESAHQRLQLCLLRRHQRRVGLHQHALTAARVGVFEIGTMRKLGKAKQQEQPLSEQRQRQPGARRPQPPPVARLPPLNLSVCGCPLTIKCGTWQGRTRPYHTPPG